MPKLSCTCGTVVELTWSTLRARAGTELACPICGKVRRLPLMIVEPEPEPEPPPAEEEEPQADEATPAAGAELPIELVYASAFDPSVDIEVAPVTVDCSAVEFGTIEFQTIHLETLRGESVPAPPIVIRPIDQTPPADDTPADAQDLEGLPVWRAVACRLWQRACRVWQGWKSRERQLTSWGVSAGVHGLALLCLALWVLPLPAASEAVWIDSFFSDADDAALEMIAADAANVTPASSASESQTAPRPSAAALAVVGSHPAAAESAAPTTTEPVADVALARQPLNPDMGTALLETVAVSVPRRSVADGGVVSAGGQGVQGALAGLLAGLRDRRGEGDLRVVWLIDASISLHQDRQLIAERLDAFYKEQAPPEQQEYKFLSSAISFGRVPRELVAPTRLGLRIPAAIRNLEVDNSGLENVMSAIEFCMQRYRRPFKGLTQIIVWTDESGDDVLKLEEVIRLCRKSRTIVSVVGPSAVLGSETGSHQYTDPGTGFAFLIPVKRGPDTSLPERLALPYWWGTQIPPVLVDGAIPALNVPRYGGAYRERLMSGFGPYALTRLALETGGTFTILSRPGDPPEFSFETMKRYAPDYSSALDYLHATQASPLRRAVSDAALRTTQAGFPPAPPVAFGVRSDIYYPFLPFADYTSPQAFRASLGTGLRRQKVAVGAMLALIQSLLSSFQSASLDAAYDAEPDARWKAWYDLTRGRLLAQHVRHREYLTACERLLEADLLKPATNLLYFHASSSLLTGDSSAAHGSEAVRCLQRCIRNNPGTPWELLAQWELEQPLGITWQEVVIPPPQPISGPAPPPAAPPPVIRLPRL